MLAGDIDHSSCLDVHRLGISLVLDLHTGLQLRFRKDSKTSEQCNGFVCHQSRNCLHHGSNVRKPTAGCLFHPFLGIAVSVKDNALMICCILLNQIMNSYRWIFGGFYNIAGICKGFCHDSIEHHVTFRHRIPGTHHSKFELISRKSKRRCTVTIRCVLSKICQSADTGMKLASPDTMGSLSCADQLLQYILQLLSQEHRNDSRRCFIGSQPVIVSYVCRRLPQKVCMAVHRPQDTGQNQQKLNVVVRRLSRIQEVNAVIRGQGPVVVLAGSVHSRKRFFMEQALQAMLFRHTFQGLHDDLVVICCHVTFCIDGSQLMLGRSHLIVLCLGRYAQFPKFCIYILHKGCDPGTDDPEIMIIQLLSFWRHSTEQSSSGKDQVFSFEILLSIYNKIFLFYADRGFHFLGCGISKKAKQTKRLSLYRFHGTKKRGLLVQCLSCIRTKGRRNAKNGSCRILAYKGWRSAIPSGITSSLKGCPKAPRWERGSIRLPFDQFLSGKLQLHGSVGKRCRNKGVMFLCRKSCQRLEPVGIMSGTFFNSPLLHSSCHHFRCHGVQFFSLIQGLVQFLVNLFRQLFQHHFIVENIDTKKFCCVLKFFHSRLLHMIVWC